MITNFEYLNGVISTKQKNLITKETLLKCLSGDINSALKLIKEYGFGGNQTETEKMIAEEEKSLYSFINENAPVKFLMQFFNADIDYHNAQVCLRSEFLKKNLYGAIKVGGLYPYEELQKMVVAVINGEEIDGISAFTNIESKFLKNAVKEGYKSLKAGGKGFELDLIFEKYLSQEKLFLSNNDETLLDIEKTEIDYKNVSSCLRSGSEKYVELSYIEGGYATKREILNIIDKEKSQNAFAYPTKYRKQIVTAISDIKEGNAVFKLENFFNSYALKKLNENKFVGEGYVPFILYIYEKINEIKNVRTVLVGIQAGLDESDVKARLRENYER